MDGDAWLVRSPAPGTMRIVSFNVRNGRAIGWRTWWWRRRRAVLETIRRLDADLVGLQEAYGFQARWLCRRLGGFACVGTGRTDGRRRGEHCLVLYRRDRFELHRAVTSWYGERRDAPGSRLPGARFPRTATLVELEDRDERVRLCLVNTHLDARLPSNRMHSVRQLAGWIDELQLPTVVVGDLNEDVDGPAVEQLAALTGLSQACPGDAGGSSHDFTGRTDGPRVDHILVPASWTVLAATVDHRRVAGRLASDHWPVVADVTCRTRP